MGITYYKYGQDILQDVLRRCGEKPDLTGVTSDYLTRTKGYIQRSYHDFIIAAPWPWALADPPGTLNIEAKKTDTAACTQDSTSVTLGTAIDDSVEGWWFEIDSEQVPYRITSHTGGTASVTLDAGYKEDSVSAGACTIYKDEYSLSSGCWKLWRAWDRNNPNRPIDIIQQGEMHDRFTNRAISASDVLRISLIKEDKIRIAPWPVTNNITLEYEYTAKITDDLTFDETSSDELIIPTQDRHVVSDMAAILLMIDKNDQRYVDIAQIVATKYNQMIQTYIAVGEFRRYVKRGQGVWR